MFVRKKKTSPEEKLLKVIEQPHSSSFSSSNRKLPFFNSGFRFKINTGNILGLSNNVLLLFALGLTAVFIVIISRPPKEIAIGKKGALPLEEQEGEELKEYAGLLKNKNPFKADFSKEKEKKAEAEEKVNLKLVGILDLLGEKQVLIESENNTYTCSVGDVVVDNIVVEKIGRNSVTLKKGDKTINLK